MKRKYISNHPLEKVWINKNGFYESDEFEVLSVKDGKQPEKHLLAKVQ